HAAGNVSSTGGDVGLGGLAGFNNENGTITNSFATGNVTTAGAFSALIGGFVGGNAGTIVGSQAAQTGDNKVSTDATTAFAGGFVAAVNFGTIGTVFASGAAKGLDNSSVGGLVALNFGIAGFDSGFAGVTAANQVIGAGSITHAYATGPATGGANSTVGGLVAS